MASEKFRLVESPLWRICRSPSRGFDQNLGLPGTHRLCFQVRVGTARRRPVPRGASVSLAGKEFFGRLRPWIPLWPLVLTSGVLSFTKEIQLGSLFRSHFRSAVRRAGRRADFRILKWRRKHASDHGNAQSQDEPPGDGPSRRHAGHAGTWQGRTQSRRPAQAIALVKLRASQINGCSFCVDMHSRELKKLGETDDRLFGVAAWRSLSAQSTL